jgi:ectoine hydroxylase-related dioxygenase (phytanoyl-CoA dioxygenase family)
VPVMFPAALKKQYEKNGFVFFRSLFDLELIKDLQQATEELIEESKYNHISDDRFDLEKDHIESNPRVQRIKVPHQQHASFAKLVRNSKLLEVLKILLGENVRFRNSKLNIKAARGGAAVDWHQDWAFYPHTNPDLLAVGIMLDDTDDANAPLMVFPQSHQGKTMDHHYKNVFCGSVNLELENLIPSSATKMTGPAGSVSFHHVKALHGSAPNSSNRHRRLLLLEYAAADAWPLVDFDVYGDYQEFEDKMVIGKSTLSPRFEDADARIPYPRPPQYNSIYRIQEYRK